MSRKRKKTEPPKRRDPHALDAKMRKGGAHRDRKKEADKYAARHWEEDEEEITVDLSCPVCESTNVTEETVTTTFDYGYPVEATLTATFPEMTCHACSSIWDDWRGEAAYSASVNEYLKTKEDK